MISSDRIDTAMGELEAAPQVIVLLDENSRVLNVNRRLAGAYFPDLSSDKLLDLHEQWHDDCDGNCAFDKLWQQAWHQLDELENIEWEVEDGVLNRLIRLNLAKPPNSRPTGPERRRRYALLTITDITAHRREHEELRARQRALEELLLNQAESIAAAGDVESSGARRVLGHNVILAQELERKRIAAELHDSVAQSLGVLKFNIEAQLHALESDGHDQRARALHPVVGQIRELVEEVRRISRNLSPATLQDFGLCAALDSLCRQVRSADVSIGYQCSTQVRSMQVPEAVEIAVYRVAQEALNNVSKHSEATNADVSLARVGNGLELLIDDDGIGFPAGSAADVPDGIPGIGLRSMRERVETTGGQFSIDSEEGDGTAVRAFWPQSALELLRD